MTATVLWFTLYIVIVVGIGVLASRRETEEGFMIAGRRVKGLPLAATFAATFFDGSVLSIYVAYVYQFGLSALSIFIGLAMGFLFLRKYAGRIKAKADQLNAYSMSEYFYRLYGKRCGLLFTAIILIMLFALLIVNLIISAKILNAIFPVSYELSVIIGGLIVLSYLLLAGFQAVVKTDFFQLMIMFVMSVGVAVLLFGRVPFSSIDWDFSPSTVGNSIGFLVLTGLGILVTPDTWQRVFAANDPVSLRKGLSNASLILIVLGLCVTVLGLATRHTFAGIKPEDALVTGFLQLLPAGFKEFAMVLLYAVALSSSDTETFVLSSMITRDLKNYTKRFGQESMRRLTRIFIVAFIAAAVSVAVAYQDIIALGLSLASLNLALFPVVFGSFYWGLRERAVFWSLVLAMASVAILFVARALDPQTATVTFPVALIAIVVLQKIPSGRGVQPFSNS